MLSSGSSVKAASGGAFIGAAESPESALTRTYGRQATKCAGGDVPKNQRRGYCQGTVRMAICLTTGLCGTILFIGCSSLDTAAKSEVLRLRDTMTREHAVAAANDFVPFRKLEYIDRRPLPPPGMRYLERGGENREFFPWKIRFTDQGIDVDTAGSLSFGTTTSHVLHDYSDIVKVKDWRPIMNASGPDHIEVEAVLYLKKGGHLFLYPNHLNEFLAAMMVLCPDAKTPIR